jgi:hypothetical protein
VLWLWLWLRELVLMLLGAGGDAEEVLFGEDAYDASSDLVVDYRLVIFSYDVDSEFLYDVDKEYVRDGIGVLTTMSSDLSSYGSISSPSGLSRSSLNVLFELLTSSMKRKTYVYKIRTPNLQ